MENDGVSLFHRKDINLSNTKENDEDEEDLEEQRRRNEELQNLLTAKLENFNFDESTVNSSTNISIESMDEIHSKYQDIPNREEQMKILYELRLREISNLKEDNDKFKKEKNEEIKQLTNKIFIYEADIQQMTISLKNCEKLLVEKTSCISDMQDKLNSQENLIKKYEQTIQNLQLDIDTYQNTISELHIKLETERNPFNIGAKQFSSEEIQKTHQEHISKLEAMLQEKTKAVSFMEKENISLQKKLETFGRIESEDKSAIKVLTRSVESAQKQCEELVEIIEKLTSENNHLRGRVNEQLLTNNLDSVEDQTNSSAIEKLKKMLVDKSVETEVLDAKLRNYEGCLKELIEYRNLKSDIYNKEFQQCENKAHTISLLMMQKDLHNYIKLLEDKNYQISSLNSTNKELLEKLQEMLSQTRNDIQNFSHKYNLPQLDKMTEDLRKSQDRIIYLENQLKESEKKIVSLCAKLEYQNNTSDKEIDIGNKKTDYENQIKHNEELELAIKEQANLKTRVEQLIDENSKLRLKLKSSHLESAKNIEESIEDRDRTLKNDKNANQKTLDEIKRLEELVQDFTNEKILLEGEQCNLRYQIADYKITFDEQTETIKNLEKEISNLKSVLTDKNNIINELQQNPSLKDFKELSEKFSTIKQQLIILEKEKSYLLQQYEKSKEELQKSREEIVRLTKELTLESETNLKNVLNTQSSLKCELRNRDESNTVSIELKLREEIQKEYLEKLQEIERKYENSCTFNKRLHLEQCEHFKLQENKYREQLGVVLAECAQKIKILEDEKQDLLRKINNIEESFNNYKQHIAASDEAYKKIIKESQLERQTLAEYWKNWSKKLENHYYESQNVYKSNIESVLYKLETFDQEVTGVEKMYSEKIKKYVKNCKI